MPSSTSRGSGTFAGGESETECLRADPFCWRAGSCSDAPDPCEARDSDEERGLKAGLRSCDCGRDAGASRLVERGAGEYERLRGGGEPEGVEWPERRSSHI